MAELSTVARPYAEALFGVACADQAGLAVWADLVSEMAQVAAQPDVRDALSDLRLDNAQRADVLTSLVSSELPQAARQFIALLVDNDRLLLLPEIAAQFEAQKNRHEGVAQADILSAFALDDAQVQDLLAGLQKTFGLKLKARVTVDPSLIGGVRVTVGDKVLDTSVQAQLAQMRDKLAASVDD